MKNINAIYLVNGREARFLGARDKHTFYSSNGELLGEMYSKYDVQYLDDKSYEYDLKWSDLTWLRDI